MAIHKYTRGEDGADVGVYKKDMLPIVEDGGVPVFVSKDGKVHAKGFVDINDNFEFYSENDEFKVRLKDEQPNYFKEYTFTKTNDKIYSTIVFDSLYQCFENILFPTKTYSNEEPSEEHKRYRLLSRKTKNEIKSITSSMSDAVSFHFHFFENNVRHVEPLVEGAWFGPYNFDVYLDAFNLVQNINDLVVVRSGEYYQEPQTPTQHNISTVLFTTGTVGHVHVQTPSIPRHNHEVPINTEDRFFKFKNKDHGGLAVASASETVSAITGVAGVFKNGVFLHGVSNAQSFMGSGVWLENTFVSQGADVCNGRVDINSNLENDGGYHYIAAPVCVDGVLDDTKHSPLLGFAKDGFPIYGPYGYTESLNPTSTIKRVGTSYRLKQAASRASQNHGKSGPAFDSVFPSGFFLQDYEYVNNLGDLDEHNGRTCVTPEFPNGTYAYFSTLNSNLSPEYPYVIGPSYRGKIHDGDGYDGVLTETPVYYRGYIEDRNQLENIYPWPQVNVWDVYGDTNKKNLGLKSEKIIFVSPHIVVKNTGAFLYTGQEQRYKSDGTTAATYSGNLRKAVGNGDFLVKKEQYFYPTSEDCHFLGGNPFSGGMTFLYEDPDTSTSLMSIHNASVTGTHFYSQYKNHKRVKNKVHSGIWRGVIPAGTPFKVENWCFNGDWAGYEGTISVRPWESHPLTSGNMAVISATLSGYGSTYELAYANAMDQARYEMTKKVNVLLVNSGVKNKNAKMRAWEKMKEITL